MSNFNNDEDDDWGDWDDAEEFPSPKQNEVKPSDTAANTKSVEDTKRSAPIEEVVNKHLGQSTSATIIPETSSTTEGWSGSIWGVLSKVSNITNTVSQGLNQVIGVPDPEEMARINAEEAKQKAKAMPTMSTPVDDATKNKTTDDEQNAFGLSLVSGVTSLGSKVLNTGLDTLEGIGKKTMTILQENDPLLMNKRKLLRLEQDRPNLSELLMEAKKDADHLENQLKEIQLEKSKEQLRFEPLFENHCGLVHLEALGILSEESTLKLERLLEAVSGNALMELQETVNEVGELIELEDIDSSHYESDGDYDAIELRKRFDEAVADADLSINFDDVVGNWTETLNWLAEHDPSSSSSTNTINTEEQTIYAQAINALSLSCALQVCKLHKIAELLLVKEHHSTANEVDAILMLTTQFNTHLHGLTNRYAAILTARATPEAKLCVSTLFSELIQATQQIHKASKLFLPILQIGAI